MIVAHTAGIEEIIAQPLTNSFPPRTTRHDIPSTAVPHPRPAPVKRGPTGCEWIGWMVALLVGREWNGWMVALLVGRELDGWVVALLVGRELR